MDVKCNFTGYPEIERRRIDTILGVHQPCGMHSSFQQLQFHLASPASPHGTSNDDNYNDDNDDDNDDDDDDDDELVISVSLEGEKNSEKHPQAIRGIQDDERRSVSLEKECHEREGRWKTKVVRDKDPSNMEKGVT
ncbi:hypothetical protein HZH66_009633 [Vespula vulgaris]|uniref:Uncharacterized protein n=1 Tax=Vespula vulgaris TaxID=7454 RepID=A0A834JLN9_VESVU|nr:hypothetical protein HZH66_009633 [Vespula vulgaris]